LQLNVLTAGQTESWFSGYRLVEYKALSSAAAVSTMP